MALFSLCLAALAPRPAAAQPASDEALAAKVEAIAASALKEPLAAGLSIGVARGGTFIVKKGYGLADVEHGVPATDATIFRIASITKQYTAAAIMKLMEQGKLKLDDNINKYVDFPTQGHTVTIRHLLNHTSGIKSHTNLPEFFKTGVAADQTPEEVLAPVRDLPFDFEPGTRWAYNNSGYVLLGMIIEKVTGVPYAKHLQDQFFTPLKLDHTRYDVATDIVPNRARGYRPQDGKLANAPHMSMTIPYAAGSLMSTAGDLVAWHLALASGKVVSLDSYTQMTTTTTLTGGEPTDYGFGLKIRDFNGEACVMHGGGIIGFNSMLAYFPHTKLSVAVISNSEAVPAGRIAQEIIKEALGHNTPDPSLKDLVLPAAELDSLAGTYRLEDIKMDLAVTIADGKVKVQGTGQPSVPVMAQGERVFRADWDKSMKLTFDPPVDGKCPSLTLEQGGGTFKGIRVP